MFPKEAKLISDSLGFMGMMAFYFLPTVREIIELWTKCLKPAYFANGYLMPSGG